MWNDDDRKWLYEQMKKNGVNTGSYDDFTKSLDNKEDRDWYYQKSRSLGLNVGSADDFASMMVQPVQKPAPAPSPAQPVVKQTTGQVNPTVNTSVQPKQVGMQIDETIQNVNQRQQNMMEYSKQRLQHPFGQPQVQIGLNRKNTPTVFDNRNLVQGRDDFNPETGKLEPTYLTASGNKYNSKVMADAEQRQIDKETERALHPVETELRDAYAERDKLQKELDERGKGVRGSMDMLSYATAAVNNDGRIPEWNDREYQKLESALRSNQKRIKALEAEMADHGQTQFWRGFADTTTDPDTWLFGIPGLMDAGALWGVSQKLNKGKPLTEGEKAVLEQSMKENQVQAQYGSNRGSMYSWGNISAAALPFVAEFVATGGMSGVASAGTIAGERAAAKYATNAATKWLMKNTGTLAGDVAAGFVMANTTGAAKTVGNAISRHVGNATIDKNGKYGFEGGEDWIPSIYKAEAEQTIEYFTERLGEHLHLGSRLSKGAEKLGLGKLSKAVNYLSDNRWLAKGGLQDYPSEVLEEEAGIILNAMFVGDNKVSDLWDTRTQADIWGGMAFSIGLMNVPKYANTGYQTAQYYRYKHKTDKSGNAAAALIGDVVWKPMRERIDGTDNANMADEVFSILSDNNLQENEKKAAIGYIQNLITMRGYNMGLMNEAKEAVNSGTDSNNYAHELDRSYTAGYESTEIGDRQDVILDMNYRRGQVESFVDSDMMALMDGNPMEAVSAIRNNGQWSNEQKQAAIDYVTANNSQEAMLQRINDDADALADEQREQTKQMQHTDGSIRPAILKEKDSEGNDRQVFIVDGNVQMMADGSMVDPEASDKSVVIFDPATGERKMIDPTADTGISSLGEVTTAEQREADIERSRQEYVQSQIDEAQGTVRFVPGQQLVLPTGEEAVVVATDADGENITVALGDGTQATVQRSELQRIRDEKASADYRQRHGITEEPAAQQPEASTPAQPQADGRVAGAPADYTADMELTIRDEDGEEKPAMVMGMFRMEATGPVADADGKLVGFLMDGEPHFEHVTKLGDKVVSHTEERTVPKEMPQYSLYDDVYLQTEDGEIHGNVIAEENPDGLITIQSEQPIGGRIVNQFTREQLDGMTGNNVVENIPVQGNNEGEKIPQTPIETPTPVEQTAEVAQQPVQEPVQTVEPQPAQPAEAPAQPTEQPTAEPMPVGEDGEEDWQATTPERAHAYIFNEAGLSRSEGNEFIAAQTQAAQSALVKAKSAQMPRVGTSIKKYNEAKAKRQEKIDEAQRVLDYWNGVREIQNAIQREENERRAAEDAVRHDEAVAEAQAEYEARKQAEAERKAVGNENPMPAITEKWNNATKVDGHRDEIMLPDGTPLKGHYVLHESGASSPSHNPETWQKTDGFPMDANDNSVNDRDYERDHDAQEHTQSIARQYDQRALQSVPVVSNDGVVLSGNGRTMAGQLAARDNTDGAYVDYLKEYAPKFGFTAEQVEAMRHPRVSFVPYEAMPYTAETFAKFNQQEMKSQNKTEQAVKLGKTVSDDSFKGIVRTINGYDTLGDFYNDAEASLGAVYDLHNAGVVPQAQLAEMVDGVRGQEKLSAVGREFLENMLIGKAFESDPEVVRMLTAESAMRQTVITALGEIVDNIALGGDWSLQGELADAVKLCFDARQGGAKYGEIVSTYARQGVLFADPDELQTVADFNNATMLMLADVLNDKRVTLLKTTLQLYNNNARQSAMGQTDLFAGGIQSREDILRDVITFINENYGKRKEIEAARAAAVERRKAESVQQDGTPPAVNNGSEDTGRSERSEEEIARLTHDEAITLIAQMEERADVAPDVELTIENWDAQFGEDGRVNTPIGDVKMGENQFTKLMRQGREGKLGMVKPTLETPDVIIEDASEAKDGDVAERKSSYVFVKAFKKADGSRYYYFTSVTVSKDGKEVVISNQEKRKNAIANLLTNGKLVWKHADDVSAASDVEQGLYSSQGNMSDPTTEGTDAPQTNVLSASKGSKNSATVQEKTVKVAENQAPNSEEIMQANDAETSRTRDDKAEGDTKEDADLQENLSEDEKNLLDLKDFVSNTDSSKRAAIDGNNFDAEALYIPLLIDGKPSNLGVVTVVSDNVLDDAIQIAVYDYSNEIDDKTTSGWQKWGDLADAYNEQAVNADKTYVRGDTATLGFRTVDAAIKFDEWLKSRGNKAKKVVSEQKQQTTDTLKNDTEAKQLGEQLNKPTVKAGEDYVSAAERIAREDEVKRTAAHFAEETQEEATAFDKRVPEMDDVELLAYMQEDGRGDLNKAYHPSVYDEYDYRHGDEQLQSYDDTLVRLNESGTTLEQAEEMLANIQKDVSRLATEDRAMLLGQEDALQEYIAGLEKEGGRDVAIPSQQTEQNESDTTSSTINGNGRLPEPRRKNAQGSGKKSSSDGKIDDVGEVLAGARKDMRKEIAKSLANVTEAALVEKPFGKVYKNPDLKKAVESGALREKDAIFYEALFSMVNQQKPKVTQSEMRSKRYIPDHKTKAERWAADTFKQMEVLRQFMELDEPGRDAMMERMLADRYPTREQELAEIEKRKGWNPDYEGHKYEWGEMTTPNPLWVTHEVMNRLGYSVGDKLDVPYGVVKANTSGTGYSIENLKGERASLFGSGMTLDEAIDRIVYLAKLKRGDADVSHPTQLFAFPATKSESGESGRYRVMWGRDYKTREFDSKDEADAFAQTKNGAYVSPIMETKRRFGYKVRFIHPLTGEKMFVDDTEFDTKEEAQAYFDGNFEKLNEATNAKLQEEREKKGEKKTLTADDVVHVTMVHSGKGGWTHAVVIDKKYANNDGQVRIIKEGFASRKDAKSFADSVKDDVLKTVLKHKEDAKKIVYFDTGENSRIGEDYRNGKNVDAEDFMNTFGFRGVQFGNWTNQADRQMAVNQAYDAFMDMARLIGVSPKAMSLNGELGIAFGARGVGGFAAHYEPGEVVINLTKTQGAGSLAHEWWHALDNYFARRAGSAGDMVTDNRRIEMRDALRKAFNDMLDLVNGSDYAQRSAAKGEYWGRTHEITARLLAEWVDRELKKRGELNTFLSRGAVVERGQQHNYDVYEVLERLAGREPMPFEEYKELPESLKGIPYPSAKEVEQFGGSLRHIFDTLEEKVDEETGNVMLYEPTATYETRDGGKVVCRSLFDEMGVRDEGETTETSPQNGEAPDSTSFNPSELRLRKLKKGETCHVERVYEETKQFDFTGKEKVESAEDVAYIFRQLENAAVENSFLVLVKDGRPTVIHLGMGGYVSVMAPYEQALVAYRELKPEQVYFVHNHPSGVLKASRQDQELLKRVKMAFGEDVVQQGIIIDTTSGKYGEFDMVADNYDLVQTSGVEAMPQSEGADVPVKVYQFSRQVFAPDWNPESAFKIVSSQSVAEFVSSHRLGEHKKMSFLVVNNSGNVVANVFLPWTKLSDIKRSKAGDLLAGYVHQCGGVRGVLYGNYDYEADDRAVLAAVGGRMRQLNAPLMDALHVEHSAYESGWAGVGEPGVGYGVDARDGKPFEYADELKQAKEKLAEYEELMKAEMAEKEAKYAEMDASVEAAKGVQLSDKEDGEITKDGDMYRDGEYDDDIEQDSTMQEDRDMMRSAVQQMGEKLHTNINIIEDVNEITHPNASVQERRRKSKGWYDTATGQVNIVLDNNRNIDDVKASVGHETIAHKGLRELVGEENYDEFLDETYQHLRDDLKKGVDAAAGRAFVDDATNNGRRAKSYEQHRRTAVDELFGRLAEKPFEEFSEGERTLWQKIKATVRRLLDKFLGSLKLPKWFELGDNELRYILWRSKERLERGKEHPIDLARDIVKRDELGLSDNARDMMGEEAAHFHTVIDEMFDNADFDKTAHQRERYDLGKTPTWMKRIGIAGDRFSLSFKNIKTHKGKDADHDLTREEWHQLPDALKNPFAVTRYNDASDRFRLYVNIMHNGNYVAVGVDVKRVNQGRNLPMLEVNSIKTVFAHHGEIGGGEKLITYDKEITPEQEALLRGLDFREYPSIQELSAAKVGRISETASNVNQKVGESTDLYRDPEETEDIWNDQSLGLQERITAAATRLANNHRDNKTLRNDAMRAIGGNLSDLRKAMSLQRTFDMTTVKRVADLARVLMNNGYLNGLTQQEVKRLLAAVKNSVGHNDIEGDVQKVMDIMVDNQLKHAEDTLHELEAIRGSKVDARGVEVQGQLDPAGAQTMKVLKKTRGWERTDIEEAISEAQQRMGSSDVAVADEAALEYTGLQLALEYSENIKGSKVEEHKLREEIKQAHDDASERDRATDSYRQYIASLQEAIRQNKIERAQSYFDLVGRLSDSLRESIANAKNFKEAEKQRIREIQHNANSDMEGRASNEHQMPANTRKKMNNLMGNSLFAPLATYMEMLRLFGRRSANGEGYLFNRFGRGWIDARQKEIRGVRDKYAMLDRKAAELFGGKVKTWGDLIRRVGKLPKGTVSFWNGGEMQERELTQGNLMYIYMVNKMLDGRMKLRKMGITEENVADIEEVLDPRLIELADWMQDEFLVETRNEYNETHKRMFGASMAAIEHYFPLRVLKNAIDVKAEDLDKPEVTDGISTITGGIIKRRRNSKPLDILNADALHVILSHVAEMEHWNAYAEFNRDLNTLRSYRRFRNQVQNMNTIYGNGKELWDKFNDVCQMATGAYKPKGDGIEKAILSAAQGVTAAKVSFRQFTALKQFASLPAYFPYVRADYLVKSMARPDVSWSWCMEHLPIFEERWKSRVSGDPRLAKSILTAADWQQNLAAKVARAGMVPNAFVDALTVSMGAYAVYQTRKGQYLRDGYSEEQAERRAIQDAEIVYNETQQSGESAFTSTMQTDRTWWKVMFSIFRNSSMAYQRQLHGALRDIGNMMKKGGVSERLAFMKKQMMRDGLSEAQADSASKRRLRRQFVKDGLAVATFGYIMQLAWNITGYLPYLLFGDDDETKDEFWDDIWTHTMGGWLEGLTGGDVMSLGIGMWLSGEVDEWKLKKEMPLTTDLYKTGSELFKGDYGAFVTDAVNLCVQIGLGVNPQSITDGVLAIMDACGDDPALAHEATICISRILQVPQSQIDKMYFDEVCLSGDEVSKYTPAQLAERYAEFKVKRGRFFSPWSWGDEERIKKFTDKANKTIKERTEQMGDDKVNEAYLQYEEVYKGVDAKVKEAKKMAKTDYVEAAQLMAEAQSDPNAFATYQMFKQMDGNFNKIVKFYLGAKTPDEAALCRQAVLDYKSAMVKVLDAPDAATRAEAMGNLGNVMQEFTQKYVPMQQPNR